MNMSDLASRFVVAMRHGTRCGQNANPKKSRLEEAGGMSCSCDGEQYPSIGSQSKTPLPPEHARPSTRVREWRRRVLLRKGAKIHERMGEEADHRTLAVLDEFGMVVAWYDPLDGVANADVVLTHVSRFYIPTDVANKVPTQNLNTALMDGSNTTRGWRKDAGGRVFWGATEITPIFLRDGRLQGYAHLTRETKAISDAVPGNAMRI